MTETTFYLHIDRSTGDLMVDWKLGGCGVTVTTPLKSADYTREFFGMMRDEMGLSDIQNLVIVASSDIDFPDDSAANDAAKAVIDEIFGREEGVQVTEIHEPFRSTR